MQLTKTIKFDTFSSSYRSMMTYCHCTYMNVHNADIAGNSHGAKRSIFHARFPSTSAGEYSSLGNKYFG